MTYALLRAELLGLAAECRQRYGPSVFETALRRIVAKADESETPERKPDGEVPQEASGG